jgi:lipopolysaccharide heptosyltransferase I
MNAPRILISRLSAIGDVIHGLPVLNALRRQFPAATLAWVVESRAAALLRGHPALDELIEVPRGWLKSPREVWRLRRRLRSLRFTTSIDLQGLAKSALAARLAGAPERIGFGDEKGRELSRWLINTPVIASAPHIIDANLQLLRPLGIESPAAEFNLPERSPDRQAAETIIQEAQVAGGFAIVNPGAGWPSKLWPAARYAAVAAHLGRVWSLPTIVVWAGSQERAWADQIAEESAGHARTAPSTTLTQLAALARRARLFIGSDTGPLHLAAAVGATCVGLYGPMPAERNGPYGPQHIALQVRRFEGTSRQRRTAPAELMEAITVEMACGACDRLLSRASAAEVA